MDNVVLQGGAFGLCVLMLSLLSWIIKRQANTIDNHLDHIQTTLDSLPCRTGAQCPEKKP